MDSYNSVLNRISQSRRIIVSVCVCVKCFSLINKRSVDFKFIISIVAVNYGYSLIRINATEEWEYKLCRGYKFLNELRNVYAAYYLCENFISTQLPLEFETNYKKYKLCFDLNIRKNTRTDFFEGYFFQIPTNYLKINYILQPASCTQYNGTDGALLWLYFNSSDVITEDEHRKTVMNKLQTNYDNLQIIETSCYAKLYNHFMDSGAWRAKYVVCVCTDFYIFIIDAVREYFEPLYNERSFLIYVMSVPLSSYRNDDEKLGIYISDLTFIYNTTGCPQNILADYNVVSEAYLNNFYYDPNTVVNLSIWHNRTSEIQKIILYYYRLLIYDYFNQTKTQIIDNYVISVLSNRTLPETQVMEMIKMNLESVDIVVKITNLFDFYITHPKSILNEITDISKLSLLRQVDEMLHKRVALIASMFITAMEALCLPSGLKIFEELLIFADNDDNLLMKAHVLKLICFVLHWRPVDLRKPIELNISLYDLLLSNRLVNQNYTYDARILTVLDSVRVLKIINKLEKACALENKTEQPIQDLEICDCLHIFHAYLKSVSSSKTEVINIYDKIIKEIHLNHVDPTTIRIILNLVSEHTESILQNFSINREMIERFLTITKLLTEKTMFDSKLCSLLVRLLAKWEALTLESKKLMLEFVSILVKKPIWKLKFFKFNLIPILLDILQIILLRLQEKSIELLVITSDLLSQFVDIPECWSYFTNRVPPLDHILATFDIIEVTGDTRFLIILIEVFYRFVNIDKRLLVRIAKHIRPNLIYYICKSPSEELVTSAIKLLEQLCNDSRNLRELASSSYCSQIEVKINTHWKANSQIVSYYQMLKRELDSLEEEEQHEISSYKKSHVFLKKKALPGKLLHKR